MDYEKKYKEALCWIQKLYPTMTGAAKENAEHFFPELKEKKNEDEKIRKTLIEYLHTLPNHYTHGGVCVLEWIAWLEKQKVITIQEDLQGKEDVLWCIKQAQKYAKDENEMGTCWFAENWLKKQGEQKLIVEMKTPEESLGVDSDTYNKIVDECVYGEQKPADKVEPKFKVGDWISNGERTTQVVSLGTGLYVINRENLSEMSLSMKFVEKWYHLWTIQDAKDGDVLFIEIDASTCIFKKFEENLLYSYIISDGKLLIEDSHYYYETSDNVHPATKEQRDLLFAKMKEAGYEWDDEKLELKKIKQGSAEEYSFNIESELFQQLTKEQQVLWRKEVEQAYNAGAEAQKPSEWSREDERIYRGIHNLIYSTPYCDSRKEFSDWLESLKNKVQPNPTKWSEEDDIMKQNCHKMLALLRPNSSEIIKDTIDNCHHWLKSLKNRTQQKHEWSKEDEGFLNLLLAVFTNEHPNGVFSTGNIATFNGDCVTSDRIIAWLKSLRPQPKQDWSEEDKVWIDRACMLLDELNHLSTLTLAKIPSNVNDIISHLKSLRPQNRWKPSDEQMKALNYVVNLMASSESPKENDYYYNVFKDLREQLKKLKGD